LNCFGEKHLNINPLPEIALMPSPLDYGEDTNVKETGSPAGQAGMTRIKRIFISAKQKNLWKSIAK